MKYILSTISEEANLIFQGNKEEWPSLSFKRYEKWICILKEHWRTFKWKKKKILQKMSCYWYKEKNASPEKVDTPGADERGWRWWLAGGQQYLALGSTHREKIQQGPLTPLWAENFQKWEEGAQPITDMIINVLVQNGARPSCLFLTQESIFRRTCSLDHQWFVHAASSVFSHSPHSWGHWADLQKLTVCVRCSKISLCR